MKILKLRNFYEIKIYFYIFLQSFICQSNMDHEQNCFKGIKMELVIAME